MFKYFKQFYDWDDFMATVMHNVYNPHAIYGLRQLICRLGRHDVEVQEIDAKHNSVILQCVYCLHRKSSCLPH